MLGLEKDLLVGVDLGGTKVAAGVVDRTGHLLTKATRDTHAERGAEAVAATIADAVAAALAQIKDGDARLLGIGAGVPGLADVDAGVVLFAPNLGWQDVPLAALLRAHRPVPVYLDNDANAAALGEQWVGAGRGVKDMILLTLGTGVGGGLIFDSRIYQGAAGYAGEIGHMAMSQDGPLCGCGRRGCLETYASATAVIREAREAIERGEETTIKALADASPKGLEARTVFRAAAQGDAVAQRIVDQLVRYLGIAIANLVNLLNPEMVVIGGGVAAAGDQLLMPLRAEVHGRALSGPAHSAAIIGAQLGNDAGIIGASSLVLRGRSDRYHVNV